MTTFEYEGKTYELKMTRAGIRSAEAQGLTTSEISEKPFSAVNLLFFAALYSKYKVNPNRAAEILDGVLDSGDIEFQVLYEELVEAYTALFGVGGSE